MLIQRATFEGNWGRGLGGALSILEGLVDSTVQIVSSTFKHNSAGQGGAIGINGHPAVEINDGVETDENGNSIFTSNTALDGGAIFYHGGSHVGNTFQVQDDNVDIWYCYKLHGT